MKEENTQIALRDLLPNVPTGVMVDYGDGEPRPVFVPIGYSLGNKASEWQRRQKFGQCVPPNDEADRVRYQMALERPRTHNRLSTHPQQVLPKRGDVKPTSIPRKNVRDDGRGLF